MLFGMGQELPLKIILIIKGPNMDLQLVEEIWYALKSHIHSTYDIEAAADTLVNLLIDNNCEAGDIKDTFKGERVIMSALKAYIDQHDSEDDEDDDEEFYDADEDDEW
jgi:hypothetical protein